MGGGETGGEGEGGEADLIGEMEMGREFGGWRVGASCGKVFFFLHGLHYVVFDLLREVVSARKRKTLQWQSATTMHDEVGSCVALHFIALKEETLS